jgi:transaldolase
LVPLRRASVSQCESGILVVIQFMPHTRASFECSTANRSKSLVCAPVTIGCPGWQIGVPAVAVPAARAQVKIPATKEGIPAIRTSIAAGINVNVTLIFSLSRYAEVMNAYLEGIEERVAKDLPVNQIASVASFFVSRVDSKVDPKLPEDSPLRGKAAVANAKLAYEQFEAIFTSPRFATLKARFRARVQRPLWASTGTKNPSYPDTLYVDELIGPDTVNTVPPATLDAFRDHGTATMTITRDLEVHAANFC